MKIACVGAGPAGLYFSVLMKSRHPEHEITVFERQPPGVTFGWGLGFFDDLLGLLKERDLETFQAISESAYRWDGQTFDVDGYRTHDGTNSGYSIGRQLLRDLLADRAAGLGVQIEYERDVTTRSELEEFDVIVASDGVNSRLREAEATHFGSKVVEATNRFLWLGTTQVFPSFMALFEKTAAGWVWAEGCGISDETSAFVVECAPDTWDRLRFATRPKEETLAYLEGVFAESLKGHPLMSQVDTDGPLPWLHFRTLTNEHLYSGNMVLLGDAAHTTHYSIGSGTTSAIGDAIALVDHLDQRDDLQSALSAYERDRQTRLVRTQTEARFSALWLEQIHRYIDLPPEQFQALWQVRRSPLLPKIPPRLYYRLHQLSSVPILRRVRDEIGIRVRNQQR